MKRKGIFAKIMLFVSLLVLIAICSVNSTYAWLKIDTQKGIYPYFHELKSGQDTQVIMEDRETIMIGSNNYLGLTSEPSVVNAGVEALAVDDHIAPCHFRQAQDDSGQGSLPASGFSIYHDTFLIELCALCKALNDFCAVCAVSQFIFPESKTVCISRRFFVARKHI